MRSKLLQLAVLFALVVLHGCGGSSSSSTETDNSIPKKWTYMVYMAADNNLSSSAINDLNEMEKVGSTANINVVAMAEFNIKDSPNGTAFSKRGKIRKDDNNNKVTSLSDMPSNLDMGAPQTLTDFIKWTKANYPAENYALVLWSHGDGWKEVQPTTGLFKGALEDVTSGSYMSTADIAKAIKEAGGVSFLDFDACLMGMYEVAYQMRDIAKVMVASADLTPSYGNSYDTLLTAFNSQPAATPMDLAHLSVATYIKSFDKYIDATPKAIIDLSKIEALHQSIIQVGKRLHELLPTERTEISLARDATFEYDEAGNLDLLDLFKHLQSGVADTTLYNEINTTISNLKAATTVSINTFTSTKADQLRRKTLGGLAIYFPIVADTSAATLGLYEAMDVKGSSSYAWPDFVYEWISGSDTFAQLTNTGGFSYKLTWDDPKANLDLVIGEPAYYYDASMGATSDNGYFSKDSALSGLTEETYTAALNIAKGSYDVLINELSYDGGMLSTSPNINATLWYKDPLKGMNTYQVVQHFTLNFNNPAPLLAHIQNDIVQAKKSVYSDWVYAGAQTR